MLAICNHQCKIPHSFPHLVVTKWMFTWWCSTECIWSNHWHAFPLGVTSKVIGKSLSCRFLAAFCGPLCVLCNVLDKNQFGYTWVDMEGFDVCHHGSVLFDFRTSIKISTNIYKHTVLMRMVCESPSQSLVKKNARKRLVWNGMNMYELGWIWLNWYDC